MKVPFTIIMKRYSRTQRRRYLVVNVASGEVQEDFRGKGCQAQARNRVKLLHTLERADWREKVHSLPPLESTESAENTE